MEIIFHSHANETHFHKKGCAPFLIWKWGFLKLGSGLLISFIVFWLLLLLNIYFWPLTVFERISVTFAAHTTEMYWSVVSETVMSSEDDCYQSTRLPCIVRTFNFTNERSFAKTSKSTIHNSTIWVRMTMSLKQAIPEYQELPFLKRGEVLKRSCKNDFYLLRIKIHFHTSGFTLCLVLKQSLGGNSGMAHRFIDKH